MKKFMKAVIISILTVLSAIIFAGCGGDNFQGTWVNKDPKDFVHTLNIEKNGESYLVQTGSYHYDLYGAYKQINEAEEPKSPGLSDYAADMEGSKKLAAAYKAFVKLYDFTPVFTKEISEKMPASLKEKTLTISTRPNTPITYVEKDGTLLYDGETYVRVKSEKDLEEAKKSIEEGTKKNIEKEMEYLNRHHTSKLNNITFEDKDSFEPIIK